MINVLFFFLCFSFCVLFCLFLFLHWMAHVRFFLIASIKNASPHLSPANYHNLHVDFVYFVALCFALCYFIESNAKNHIRSATNRTIIQLIDVNRSIQSFYRAFVIRIIIRAFNLNATEFVAFSFCSMYKVIRQFPEISTWNDNETWREKKTKSKISK